MVVLEMKIFYELRFRFVSTIFCNITQIQLCLWVHRQVHFDKISSIPVKRYKYLLEIAFWIIIL